MDLICEDCNKVASVFLSDTSGLCLDHFKSRCGVTEGPAMSYMFGPSILTIVWDPNQGDCVPDAVAMSRVDREIDNFKKYRGDVTHIIGQSLLLNCYRLRIAQGILPHYHVILKHKCKVYLFTEDAGVKGGWPKELAHDGFAVTQELTRTIKRNKDIK